VVAAAIYAKASTDPPTSRKKHFWSPEQAFIGIYLRCLRTSLHTLTRHIRNNTQADIGKIQQNIAGCFTYLQNKTSPQDATQFLYKALLNKLFTDTEAKAIPDEISTLTRADTAATLHEALVAEIKRTSKYTHAANKKATHIKISYYTSKREAKRQAGKLGAVLQSLLNKPLKDPLPSLLQPNK
jgi:hypothetical protein